MLNRATVKNVLWPLIPGEMRVTPTKDDMLIVERRGEGEVPVDKICLQKLMRRNQDGNTFRRWNGSCQAIRVDHHQVSTALWVVADGQSMWRPSQADCASCAPASFPVPSSTSSATTCPTPIASPATKYPILLQPASRAR